MSALESIIDLHDMNLRFPKMSAEAPLSQLPTSHVAVDVCDFHQGILEISPFNMDEGRRCIEMSRRLDSVGMDEPPKP